MMPPFVTAWSTRSTRICRSRSRWTDCRARSARCSTADRADRRASREQRELWTASCGSRPPGLAFIQRRKEFAMTDARELAAIDAYWRAANYLSVGQIYLRDNALLRQPLSREHIKPRL